jgi:DNA-directed RNA polymerase specialized sigma24 family protein
MTNERALQLADKFLKKNDSQAFEELWSSTVNMVEPYKYFDPTGARDQEDFLQATRVGLWQALQTFKEGKGSTILTWIRMRMTQLIIKELRAINRTTRLGYKISLDTTIHAPHQDMTPSVERMIYQQLVSSDSYQAATLEWSEELYWTIVADVERRLKRNIRLIKVFRIKLAFPHISRGTIARMLTISRPAISGYFETIRNCIGLATTKYAL